MRNIFILILCSLICTHNIYAQDYKYEKAIPYRSDSNDPYVKQKCLLDIYYPVDKKDFATVIWFHGGGLTSGDKEIPRELQEQGICVIGVSYRLSPLNRDDPSLINAYVTTEVSVDDAAASAAWVMKNIERYGGSPRKVYLAGHSAGGYLVSMIALDKQRLAKYEIDADKFAAVIPFSGQMITHFKNRQDRGIPDTQPLIDENAPIYYVRKDCPPLLLITGDRNREMLGRYEENAYMWRMMKVVGHPAVEIYELDGFDHGSMAHPAHSILLEYIRKNEQQKKISK